MKVAVASSGRWLASDVDFHTGRAFCFIVYDTDSETYDVLDNWTCTECLHWAGLKTAETLIRAGVSTVIVRNIGPNTFRSLVKAGITIFYTEQLSVVKAIRLYREGALSKAREHNCAGHPHLKAD